MIDPITESANTPSLLLRAWWSGQCRFIVNVRKNVGGPTCVEKAKHLAADDTKIHQYQPGKKK
jgi:hypothetical protein